MTAPEHDDPPEPPELVEPPAPERVTPPTGPPERVAPPELVEPPHPSEPAEPPSAEPPASETPSSEPPPTEPAELAALRADPSEPPPTEPSRVLPPNGEAYPGEPPGPSAAEFLGFVPLGTGQSALPSARATPPDELDELFGTERFRDYEPPPRVEPVAFGVAVPADQADAVRVSATQRTMMWVAGCLVGVLALVVVFVIGTRISGGAAAQQPPATPPATTAPAEPTVPTAPVEAGDHHWDQLVGGECIDDFVDAWADTFTVVDCDDAHDAQLVLRAAVPADADTPTTATAPYPGDTVLQPRIAGWCGAPGVVDLAAAGALTDVQVTGSYPVQTEWDAGLRDYRCFVLRASGDPLLGSLLGPAQAADWEARRAALAAPPAETAG